MHTCTPRPRVLSPPGPVHVPLATVCMHHELERQEHLLELGSVDPCITRMRLCSVHMHCTTCTTCGGPERNTHAIALDARAPRHMQWVLVPQAGQPSLPSVVLLCAGTHTCAATEGSSSGAQLLSSSCSMPRNLDTGRRNIRLKRL